MPNKPRNLEFLLTQSDCIKERGPYSVALFPSPRHNLWRTANFLTLVQFKLCTNVNQC